MAVGASEVLAETIQAAQVPALLRGLPTGDEHPLLLVRLEIVAGEDGMGGVNGFGSHEEPLLRAGLPGIHPMAVTSGAFVAEITRHDTCAFGHKRDPVLVSDLTAVHRLATTVPDAEDDAALSGAVDLHAEIATVPTAGHVVGPERIFQGSDLTIERRHVGPLRHRIGEMHRGGVAPWLKIELSLFRGGALKHQRLNVPHRSARRIEGLQRELLIPCCRDVERLEWHRDGIGSGAPDQCLVGCAGHVERSRLSAPAGNRITIEQSSLPGCLSSPNQSTLSAGSCQPEMPERCETRAPSGSGSR